MGRKLSNKIKAGKWREQQSPEVLPRSFESFSSCGENRISPSFSFCSFNLLRINTLKELSYDVLFIYSNVYLFNFVCKSKQ